MFGSIVGKILSAPIRVANIPVKIAQKAVEVADREMIGGRHYRAPAKNALNEIADTVEDACEEALDR